MTNCQICNHEVSEKFCPNCGQAVELKRINGHYIIHEIEHILHFEKGIFYTIRELLLRPGASVKNFIKKDRTRLIKPIIFIIITSLIYTIAIQLLHIDDGLVVLSEEKSTAASVMMAWVKSHYGYANIIMAIFIALWIKVFFRKYDYNFYEIIILLCFLMGMGMLLLTIGNIFQKVTGSINASQVGGAITIFYVTWAIGQFFDQKKKMNYLKAFFAYLLGMITFFSAILAIGVLIEMIKQ